jgi:hypothetical protein
MLLHLACVVTGLGVCLDGALLAYTGHAAHAVYGGILFALGAEGVGLQGWHAVKRLRGGPAGPRPRAVRGWPLCPVGRLPGKICDIRWRRVPGARDLQL